MPSLNRTGIRRDCAIFRERKLLPDAGFYFYRICPIAIRWIGDFRKIHLIDMENYAVTQAESFTQGEEMLLAELNTRHHDFLLRQLQQNGIDATDMQAIGLDCDGIDVRSGEQIWRLNFPETITESALSALATLKMGE